MINSQKTQSLFLTTGIQDLIVRQNFELLNKILSKNFSGQAIQASNIIFSAPFSFAYPPSNFFVVDNSPGQLQVQINTRGNPVRIKLASLQNLGGQTASLMLTGITGQASLSTIFGWKRQDSQGVITKIAEFLVGMSAQNASGKALQMNIPLPAFEFDDVVQEGAYSYQFFFTFTVNNVVCASSVSFQNVNVVALELR